MDIREDERVKDMVEDIGKKTRDLTDVVKYRVLEKVIAKLQEKLDQLPKPDNSLPKPQPPPEGEQLPADPNAQPK